MKKYLQASLFFVFLFGFLLSPSLTNAQTESGSSSAIACTDLKNNLRYSDRDNSKNGEVTLLQDFLRDESYLDSVSTGFLGNLTVKAVADFQKANNITPSVGFVGNLTRAKIKALTCDNQSALSESDSNENNNKEASSSPKVALPRMVLTLTPDSVQSGGKSVLSWTTENITSCTASGNPGWTGAKEVSGQQTFLNLTVARNFILTCTGPGGSISASKTVKIIVPKPVVILNATPESVEYNGKPTLTWSATDAKSCKLTGLESGKQILSLVVATSGTKTLETGLKSTGTFTLTCEGSETVSTIKIVNVIQTNAPIINLTVNPLGVTYGGSTTLSWSATNAIACTASDGWTGSKATSGSQVISNLKIPTTFTLTCTGAGSTSASISKRVEVENPPNPIVILTANPISVESGGSTSLSWSSTNTTTCTAGGGWSGTKGASGSQIISSLTTTTTFTLTCIGVSGSATDSVQVGVYIVDPIPSCFDGIQNGSETGIDIGGSCGVPLCPSGTTGTYPNCIVIEYPCPQGTVGVSPECIPVNGVINVTYPNNTETFTAGQKINVTWTTKIPQLINFQTVKIIITEIGALSGFPKTLAESTLNDGQELVTLPTSPGASFKIQIVAVWNGVTLSDSSNNYFSIIPTTCPSGYAGTPPNCIKIVCPGGTTGTYPNCVAVPVSLTFTATPSDVYLGGQSNLSWKAIGVESCFGEGGWLNTENKEGNFILNVNFLGTKTYNLICKNPGGPLITSKSVTITATQNPLYPAGCSSNSGYSLTTGLSCSPTCPSGTTGTYPNCVPLTCPSGTTGIYPNCVSIPKPTMTFTATPSIVSFGDQVTLSWSAENATTCSADNTWYGPKATSGTLTFGIYVYTSDTYTLNCTGPGGLSSASVIVNVLPSNSVYGEGCTINTVYSTTTGQLCTNASLDKTPRMDFSGVNRFAKYINDKGIWVSDTSTIVHTNEILRFCKKWYPSTTSTSSYPDKYNPHWINTSTLENLYIPVNQYTETGYATYKCVGGTHSGPSRVLGASIDLGVSPTCALSKTLMKGMQDNEVKCLQKKLNEKGYQVKGTENGNEIAFFGYNTELILKQFQKENGLKSDGILGLSTRKLLNN